MGRRYLKSAFNGVRKWMKDEDSGGDEGGMVGYELMGEDMGSGSVSGVDVVGGKNTEGERRKRE